MSRNLLSGDLNFLELAEILQLLSMTGKSGILFIESPWTDSQGQVEFSHGSPVDAFDGEKDGLEALYALFGWKGGNFSFSDNHEPKKRRINKDRMSIIMNAMRLLDEGRINILGPESQKASPSQHHITDETADEYIPLVHGGFPDYSDIVDEERFNDGQPIFLEGKFGRWVYVVLDGRVNLTKSTVAGDTTLYQMGPGTYPGSILFFSEEKARSTGLFACGQVHLGVLNLERLQSEFSTKTAEFQSLASGLALRVKKLADTIARFRFDKEVSEMDLNEMEPISLPGMDSDQVMIIKSGHGQLAIDQGEHLIPMAELGAGDIIGDIPFLDSALKMDGACVFGTNSIQLKTPDIKHLAEEYYQSSATIAAMIKNLAVRSIVSSVLAGRFFEKQM